MEQKKPQKQANLWALLGPYKLKISAMILVAMASSGLSLVLPKIISQAINQYIAGHMEIFRIALEYGSLALGILVLTYAQSLLQTYVSELVGKDLRESFSAKLSRGSYLFIERSNPSKLLTNLTSDIDSVKAFVSQAVVSIASSIFTIIGASILLLLINWRLGLAVIAIVPILGLVFFSVMGKIRPLFLKSRENIDWLNKVISESILGSAIVRVLNAQSPETEKFLAANQDSLNIGLKILRLFASMIPIIGFVANMATVVILALGGHYVIAGTLSLGNLAAFNSYIIILIFPVMIISFMTNIIARASMAYQRVYIVMGSEEEPETGELKAELSGDVAFDKVNINYGEKAALKNVSFQVHPKTRTAIVGPTAAGKTQILYLLTGLIKPGTGEIKYDGHNLADYESKSLHAQIGFVFENSIIFNLSLRENIALSQGVSDAALEKAIKTAELQDFIDTLPDKLETMVSERGTSLSGGQKQRIMLARALALNPKILLLDDFTARVDAQTERKILQNVRENYPDLTLISVTQKIAPIEDYDQIILLMEGEVLAAGRHAELMESSPEYVQIYNSQQSTSQYELQS